MDVHVHPQKSCTPLSFQPYTSGGGHHPPSGQWRGMSQSWMFHVLPEVPGEGVSPTAFGEAPASAMLHPPLSAKKELPGSRAGFEATTKMKLKTYSRTVLPEGSRRRTRCDSARTPTLCPGHPTQHWATSPPCPQHSVPLHQSSSGVLWQTHPSFFPRASQLLLLPPSRTNSPVLK